jgi:TRAP-type C4-dicarboxylate transport system permease small subunit
VSFLSIVKKITDALVVFCFSMLILLVFGQVIFRYVFNNSQPWIEELSRFLFVWIIYLGGTITIRKGLNITFDLVLEALEGKVWLTVFMLVNIISIAFLILIVFLGLNISSINRIQYSSLLHLNMGIVTLAIPLGGTLMALSQVEYCIKTIKGRNDK